MTAPEMPAEIVEAVAARSLALAVRNGDLHAQRPLSPDQITLLITRYVLAALPPAARAVLTGEAVAVPRKPTQEMIDAGTSYGDYYCDNCKGVSTDAEAAYGAMIDASPWSQDGDKP